MVVEPIRYRVKKWFVQQATGRLDRSDQHRRLNEDEWDIVVILDACRWDTLQEVASWPIGTVRSPASATPEWLATAEETNIFEDVFVVSANAQYDSVSLGEAELHRMWETSWNDRLGTVLPEPVLSKADTLLADGRTPVVAHLIPPHAPYVAKVADRWLPIFPETEIWKRDPNRDDQGDKLPPQVAMARGHLDMDRARRGYRASVESTFGVVAKYVSRWVDRELTVVVTADHGETHGRLRDLGFYGHPSNCHIRSLTRVPYERFTQSSPVERGAEGVEEKLAALGYVDR